MAALVLSPTGDSPPSVAKIAEFLGTSEGSANRLLEEGKLETALVATLRRRGVELTPNLKNSVQTLVRSMEPLRVMAPGPPQDQTSLSDGTATIMFTDMVGSSAMMERLGDRVGRRVLAIHDRIIRSEVAAYQGFEVKSMGDGFMLTFRSASRALACAVAIQKAFADYNGKRKKAPILVRIGLTVGEPINDEKDIFGMSVIIAARIAAEAGGGQVLVSEIAHALAQSSGDFDFKPVGPVAFKGVAGRHPLFEVIWEN